MATNKRLIKSNDEGGAVGASFNTVLYTGNGTKPAGPVLNFGFQPDLVWIKQRDTIRTHRLNDSVRGDFLTLSSDTTDAENIGTDVRVNFDYTSTSARVETASSGWNASGGSYVAWGWKAGGDAVTNTDGTITSQVSANTEAGFSIVSYTGNGVGGSTIGHGLNSAPDMFIVKRRDGPASWAVYHSSVGVNHTLQLDTTSAQISVSGKYSGTNSSVFGVNSASDVNFNNSNYIAYCFAEVAGFSKFGSYVGNGTSTAPFVDCGFEPAFLLFKKSSGTIPTGWVLIDNKRDNTNPNSLYLFPNNSNSEAEYPIANFYSNGFEVLGPDQTTNASGETYIYMAFANQF